MSASFVDLKLISEDAIYRDEAGTEHQVEWVTQRDVELARQISDVARRHELPASTSRCSTTSRTNASRQRWPHDDPS